MAWSNRRQGPGSFTTALYEEGFNPCSFDIEPAAGQIVQADWLDLPIRIEGFCVIGNPPFGERSKLAKLFIEASIARGASGVGFVLPATFRKPTMQSVFPSEWRLVHESKVGSEAFLFEGAPYHVESVFQLWSTIHTEMPSLRWEDKFDPSVTDFLIVRKSDEADWFVMGAAPKTVKTVDEVTPTNRRILH